MAAKPWKVVPLELPVNDKTYTILPVEYDVGLTILTAGNEDSKITADSEDRELFALVMGPTWQEMLDDKLPFPVMFRAGIASLQYQTALVTGLDNEAAVAVGEQVWESGISPEAVAAAMAANSTTSKRSTSTASASKTPARASTRTTTSQKTTPRTAPKKTAPRSTGRK